MSNKRRSPEPDVPVEYPEKSPADTRDYKYVRLSNGLTALIVHDPDPTIKKTAAALSVNVGSLQDPPNLSGCAHFLEHMVFMGSEKFPAENELESFLKSHGGFVNAMTDAEFTMYYFDIMCTEQSEIRTALDMFCNFFVSPLLRHDCVSREVQAVESEFRQALTNDFARLEQLILSHILPTASGIEAAEASKKNHPYAGFGYGNMESLFTQPKASGLDPISVLRDFFNKHYLSGNMKLALVSPLPLADLELLVRELFEAIPAARSPESEIAPEIADANAPTATAERERSIPDRDSAMFRRSSGVWGGFSSGPELVQVVPVKKGHKLTLEWVMPAVKREYRRKPQEYLGHLLGHESEGSLAENLRIKGWASDVKAGTGDSGYANTSLLSTFSVEITLTREGLKHWLEVLGEVRAYVEFLGTLPSLPAYIYEELRLQAEMEWNFQEKKDATDLAEDVVCNLQPCEGLDEADILKADWIYEEFREAEIKDVIARLRSTNNLFVILASDAFKRIVPKHANSEASDDDEDEDNQSGTSDEQDGEYSDEDDEGESDEYSDSESGSEANSEESLVFEAGEVAYFPETSEVQTEPWFGTKYWRRRFPGDSIPEGDSTQYRLPEPNKYLAKNFRVHASVQQEGEWPQSPVRVGSGGFLFVQEKLRSRPSPRVDVRVMLVPGGFSGESLSVEEFVHTKMMLGVMAETMHSEIYLAKLASIDMLADIENQGISLKFSGFSDTVFSFISLVFDRLANFHEQPNLEAHFALVQEHLYRGFLNEETRCKNSAQMIRRKFLLGNFYARGWEKAAVAKRSTLEDVLQLNRKFLATTSQAAALIAGNVESSSTVELPLSFLQNEVRFHVHIPEAKRLTERTLIVEDHENAHDHNCVVSLYLQFTGSDADQLSDLLNAVICEPMFDELRTKQQLGYEVACSTREGGGVFGFEFWVQSAVAEPSKLLSRIYEFLENFQHTLETMDESDFRSTVEALIHNKREKPHSLGEDASDLWKDLLNQRPFYNELILADWLQTHGMDKAAFAQWYKAQVVDNPRRLVVAVIGAGSKWSREVEEPLLRQIL